MAWDRAPARPLSSSTRSTPAPSAAANPLASGTAPSPGLDHGYFVYRYDEPFVITFDRATWPAPSHDPTRARPAGRPAIASGGAPPTTPGAPKLSRGSGFIRRSVLRPGRHHRGAPGPGTGHHATLASMTSKTFIASSARGATPDPFTGHAVRPVSTWARNGSSDALKLLRVRLQHGHTPIHSLKLYAGKELRA